MLAEHVWQDCPDLDETETIELIQAEATALMLWNKQKGKGKSKGKGKGFQKGTAHMTAQVFGGKSNQSAGGKAYGKGKVSLEERKKKLLELKQRTRCQACGQTGHWAGDAQCPKKSGVGLAALCVHVSASDDEGAVFMQTEAPPTGQVDEEMTDMSIEVIPPSEGQSCLDGCQSFLHKGTNAYISMKTCKSCGTVRKQRKNSTARYAPAECPHTDTDFRGSTKAERRVYCKLCCTRIQSLTIEQREQVDSTTQELNRQPEVIPAVRNVLDKRKLSKDQVLQALRLMTRQVENSDTNTDWTQQVVVSTLQDAIDTATGAIDLVASMAVGNVCAVPASSPEAIDPLMHPGIWGILDEGCNSSCHGASWATNAQKKLARLGYAVATANSGKTYRGIASTVVRATCK
eukprot:458280-Amphidinium_carterae.1